eukprot:4937979-Pyramimonas_sp.AAC.1
MPRDPTGASSSHTRSQLTRKRFMYTGGWVVRWGTYWHLAPSLPSFVLRCSATRSGAAKEMGSMMRSMI